MNTFGEVIRKKREQLNWTQRQLAEQLHVSSKSVSRWETSKGYPDIELLPVIAKLLELNYKELLDGNEYIAEKHKRKLKFIKFTLLTLICCLVLGILFYCIKPVHKEIRNARETLLNNENQIEFITFSDRLYMLDEQQKVNFLQALYIDEWQPITSQLAFDDGTYEIEFLMNYHIQKQQYSMFYYEKENHYYIHFKFSNGRRNEIYQLNHSLKNFEKNYFFEDMKNWYGFDNQKQIQGKSSYLKEISIQDAQLLPFEYSLYKSNLESYQYFYIEDQTNQRFYFILVGTLYDYQSLMTQYHQQTLTIQLEAKPYTYLKPYVHVFEVSKSVKDIEIIINNEKLSQLKIYHPLYPAKTMTSFE